MTRRILAIALGLVTLTAVAIQLVPIGVSNPPVRQEPAWDSPTTRALAKRACFDCHSNEVQVPWYGHIAPISWVVADHVEEGRTALNFSEMDRAFPEAHESGEEVLEGEMPPQYYTLLHPGARLSTAEKRQLAAGLDATLGGEGSEGGEGGEGGEWGQGDDGDEHGEREGRGFDDDD